MRISDWSSDVCSSDLCHHQDLLGRRRRLPAADPHRLDLRHELPIHAGAVLALWLSSGDRSHGDLGGAALSLFQAARLALDRIVVNPIYFKRVEQSHRAGGSPPAIPSDPDLL